MHAEGFSLEGIMVTDATSWTIVPGFCTRVRIRNFKVVNSVRHPQNDGIDPIGCQDVLVDHCFVFANDDAFCPKPGGPGTHGGGIVPGPGLELKDVTFNDCVAWTNCGAFKLGLQSGVNATNITFKNSFALACHRACTIERNGGESSTRNILFQNIGVECEPRTGALWVTISAKGRGPVEDVTFDQVKIQGGAGCRFLGLDNTFGISNLTLKDCTWGNAPITDTRSGHINAKFVRNLKFLSGK